MSPSAAAPREDDEEDVSRAVAPPEGGPVRQMDPTQDDDDDDDAATRVTLDVASWLNFAPAFEAAPVAVVLVFQVTCPGCFAHALPALLELRDAFAPSQLAVAAVATAFEDFELNTEENANQLVRDGALAGAAKRAAYQATGTTHSSLELGRKVAVGFDRLVPTASLAADERDRLLDAHALRLVRALKMQSPSGRLALRDDHALAALRDSLRSRPHFARTFDGNALLGTPGWLVFHTHSMRLVKSFTGEVSVADLHSWVSLAMHHLDTNAPSPTTSTS